MLDDLTFEVKGTGFVTKTSSCLDRQFEGIKVDALTIRKIKCNTLQVPTHGQVLPGFGETYGDIYSPHTSDPCQYQVPLDAGRESMLCDMFIFLFLVSTMILSMLVVKACSAQRIKTSELKGKKKSESKAWGRHSDAKFNLVEAEKEQRRERDAKLGISKVSAGCDSARFLALDNIIECPRTSSRNFANCVSVKEVRESLGERTSVTKSTTTTFSHCTMLSSFATSACCRLDPKPGARQHFSNEEDTLPDAGNKVLLVLVLFLLLLHSASAQQSGCADTQGSYESAISTMVCASLLSSPPTCQVVFSSLPKSTGLSSFFITVEIANSDFSSEGEYISAVILGGQPLGNLISDLKYDGADAQCNKMSKILDLAAVPMDTVSSAGELIVRIEASLGVNSNECDGSYLYAIVKLTTCTGRVLP